ncbi:DUF4175 domain-containing protein [Pararhodobacter sp.]|uniref:DUF4175 domain-containing protein n=1 Tax=Pararhodobacter sp. TaxID=2127056 RepID=UPI002FDCBDD2
MPRPADIPPAPLRRALALTRAGMVAERAARAFWLPFSLALLAGTAAAFGLPAQLPPGAWPWVAAGVALVILITVVMGLRRFRLPSRAEAAQRLDRTLPGRPLAALADAQAIGAADRASVALWAAHRSRMQAAAARARPVAPDLRLAPQDPYALRLIALTAAMVALLFGAPQRMGELAGLSSPAGAAIGPSWEGWITPPAYTGRPGLYLNEITRESFEVPQGSRVIIRFYGPAETHEVTQGLDGAPQTDETGQSVQFAALQSGPLRITGPGGRSWDVAVLPDGAPQIATTGPMRRARGGVMEQPFRATDDHGITAGEAEITLDLSAVERRHGLSLPPEPREVLRLDLPLPVAGNRAEFDELLREDLSQHPWAHLPVQVVLRATDAAGQSGESGQLAATLPGRRFFEPAALAVAEIRRDLLWNADNAQRSAQLMRAMLHRSEGTFRAEAAPGILNEAIRAIEVRLDTGDWSPAARDEVAAKLWDLALLIEEGELANARERLRRIQDQLDEAMRNGATPEEIEELMDELREAMRDYMRMLAEQPRERGEQQAGEQMEITGSQIQELMERIQELMEEGRMDEAAELMARLNELLENLQITQGEGGEQMPGSEAMEGLGDTLGDQQSLADDTFRELQEQFNRDFRNQQEGRGDGERDGADDQTGNQTDDRTDDLAERQQALRERLREQQLQTLPGEGTPEGDAALDAIEEAQRAMDEAAEALRGGDARRALERQAEAMDSLREGMRQFNDAMRQDRSERAGGEDGQQEGQAGGQGRDPLGRQRGGDSARGEEQGSVVPGEDPRARARDLMDEIRRRSAERERPETERDYLNRLIERF